MSTRSSATARASRDIGEAFESQVDTWHEMAGLRGALAHVVHNAPPAKFVHGRLIYEETGVADWTGCMHGGVFLACEGKSVVPNGRLARSRISTKQAAHLDAVTAAGGLAFLLVEFRAAALLLHRHYVLPWHEVPWKVVRTAESLSEEDIAAHYRVNKGEDYLAKYHAGSSARYIVGERRKRTYPTE